MASDASKSLLQLADLLRAGADTLAGIRHLEGIDGKTFDVLEMSIELRLLAEKIHETGQAVVDL